MPRRRSTPQTGADLVELWKQRGYQHFHFKRLGGGQRHQWFGWAAIFNHETPACRRDGQCLILRVTDRPPHMGT